MKKKGKKIGSFAKRLTWGIALTQLVVMALASYLIYKVTKGFIQDEEIDLYKSELKIDHQNIRRVLSEVSVATTNSVPEIEENLGQPDKMYAIMERIVKQNPHIRSCGISFVADYYSQKGRWYCPYAVKGDSGQIEKRIIGNADNDYLKAAWFAEALKADSSYWSKPFFDSTDSVPLVARMVPIHDKRGRTVAIMGADLSLNWFRGTVVRSDINGQPVNVYVSNQSDIDDNSDDDGGVSWNDTKWRFVTFNFIIDKDGTFVAHPASNNVVKGNYFERAKETNDTIDDYVGRQMVAGKFGTYKDAMGSPMHFEFFDSGGLNVYLFYEPIEGTDWSIGLATPRLMIEGAGVFMGTVMLILIALGLLATRIVGRIIIKRATKPLKKLADSANEVAKGNFKAPLPRIKHNDEIRLLRDSFEGMQHSLTEYVEELKTTTASKAAIENELKVAHDIQMSMLPKTFPPYPERDDIDIYGMLTPAKDVGGDLFDFYIRDEQLFFCIGDVSGKGVPASLVMAVTRSLFRNISTHVAAPDQIAIALNNALAESNDKGMFVTAFVGVLDLATGCLHYCNAGHAAPLLLNNAVVELPCDPNLPLGVMPGWTFTPQQTTITPQTTIFLYTDGLNEAEDSIHAQFGLQRVTEMATSLLAEGLNKPAAIINKMTDAVLAFEGESGLSDDLTMLAIKYTKDNGTK